MHGVRKTSISRVTPLVIADQNRSRSGSTHSRKSHSAHTLSVPKYGLCQQCCSKENLKEQALLVATIAAVIIGIGVGIALRRLKCPGDEYVNGCRITKEDISYIDFPGRIFINILKMLILPLIVSSIISSLAQLDAQSSGKMGVRALIYYFGTTIIAAIVGIVLVLTIQPGKRGGSVDKKAAAKSAEGRTVDTVLDLFRNLFPDNIMEAAFRSVGTDLKVNRTTVIGPNNTVYNKTIYDPMVVKRDGINVLGLLLFCILFGIIISRLKEKALILKQFFEAMLEVVMQL
ncbi:unnamed protein product, partial [Adineta ricciae]